MVVLKESSFWPWLSFEPLYLLDAHLHHFPHHMWLFLQDPVLILSYNKCAPIIISTAMVLIVTPSWHVLVWPKMLICSCVGSIFSWTLCCLKTRVFSPPHCSSPHKTSEGHPSHPGSEDQKIKECITILIQILEEIKCQYFLQHLHCPLFSFIPQDRTLATAISSATPLFLASFICGDTKRSCFLPNILISHPYEPSATFYTVIFKRNIFNKSEWFSGPVVLV